MVSHGFEGSVRPLRTDGITTGSSWNAESASTSSRPALSFLTFARFGLPVFNPFSPPARAATSAFDAGPDCGAASPFGPGSPFGPAGPAGPWMPAGPLRVPRELRPPQESPNLR